MRREYDEPSSDAEVDELVCLHREGPFHIVVVYYRDFSQVSNGQEIALLLAYRQRPSPVTALLRAQRGH